MGLNYKNGDILQSTCDIICQQVNCQGVMGGGLAKHIYTKYPKVKEEYVNYCQNKMPHHLLGRLQLVIPNENQKPIIANIFGQLDYGRKNVVHTDYEALKNGLDFVFEIANISEDNLSIAIPYNIGCGLANGDWNIVCKIIEDLVDKYPNVKVEIWKL